MMRRQITVVGNPTRTIDTDIPGWMYARDLLLLANASQMMPNNSLFVEAGSFLGRSSLAIGANINPTSTLHCIDPWTTDTDNYSISDRISALEAGAMEYGEVNRVSDQMRSNFYKAAELAVSGSWLPAFKSFTSGCDIVCHAVPLEEYEPRPRLTSVVFLDAQRATDNDVTPGGDPHKAYTNLDNQLSRFINNRDILIIGNDFSPNWSSNILAVGQNKEKSRRALFCPADSALWFLWPTVGYWAAKLGDFSDRAERDRSAYWKGLI
jgi:hypothetical protein